MAGEEIIVSSSSGEEGGVRIRIDAIDRNLRAAEAQHGRAEALPLNGSGQGE